tara:strand:+ start:243 stop:431 length:189 start_codon:yes stop_codon:yes gene_type:complete
MQKVKRYKNLYPMYQYYLSARKLSKLISTEIKLESPHAHLIVTISGPRIMEAANKEAFDAVC